jgi:hypothetical protein
MVLAVNPAYVYVTIALLIFKLSLIEGSPEILRCLQVGIENKRNGIRLVDGLNSEVAGGSIGSWGSI